MISFLTSRALRHCAKASMLCAAVALSGCSGLDRLKNVGEVPDLKPISNPVAARSYKPVQMPMPRQEAAIYQANSLWRSGARAFFEDQRAASIGDILTVNIDITDSATFDNTSSRTRASSEDADITNLFGLEGSLGRVFPDAIDPSSIASLGGTSSSTGTGKVDRKESINLTVAAVVTQILPNGNLVIQGSQEVRVNFEVRELLVNGIVRPEDISNKNTIDHTQIAEARISYGGRGHLTDVQQPRYGQQVIDILLPF